MMMHGFTANHESNKASSVNSIITYGTQCFDNYYILIQEDRSMSHETYRSNSVISHGK